MTNNDLPQSTIAYHRVTAVRKHIDAHASGTLARRAFTVWHSVPELGVEATMRLVPKSSRRQVEEILERCQMADFLNRFDDAIEAYKRGDDHVLRAMTLGYSDRYIVECGISIDASGWSNNPWGFRSRKFSDPLYITPAGLLHAFPEVDEDLFLDMETAHQAVRKYMPEKLEVVTSSLRNFKTLHSTARYKRWAAEVKTLPPDIEFVEARRSLDEVAAIYKAEGMEGLKKIYSSNYCRHLLMKLRRAGLA